MYNNKNIAKILVVALLSAVMTISFELSQLNAESLEEVEELLGEAENGDSHALDKVIDILENL